MSKKPLTFRWIWDLWNIRWCEIGSSGAVKHIISPVSFEWLLFSANTSHVVVERCLGRGTLLKKDFSHCVNRSLSGLLDTQRHWIVSDSWPWDAGATQTFTRLHGSNQIFFTSLCVCVCASSQIKVYSFWRAYLCSAVSLPTLLASRWPAVIAQPLGCYGSGCLAIASST